MRESVFAVGTAVLLVFLVRGHLVDIFTVSSASMSTTLLPGDSLLVNRLLYRLYPPQRGDIIVFRFPQAAGREFVKRVVALPGDVVKEQAGRFWVNGAPLRTPSPSRSDQDVSETLNLGTLRIPAGQLYVLGDNQEESLDSRFWGTVDMRNVIGKAFLIYWSSEEHWWDVRWSRIGRWLP
jgi:signal peptidase I